MLTVMGDDPSIPWRVLSIDFLVEDMETGGIIFCFYSFNESVIDSVQ